MQSGNDGIMNKHFWVLGLVVFIAACIRFYALGTIPNGLYQDETAIGYNAYSILETGKDEHGVSFPLYFTSFGDQKLPVYIYTAAISIKLFGLTPFAVRFPSALFGVLTVILMYVLVTKLTKKKNTGLIAAAILTVNPWHIHYSRATFEVSIGLFLLMTGSWAMMKAFEHKRGWLCISLLCFVLGLYTYNLTRMLAPLLAVFSFIFLKRNQKTPGKGELLIAILPTLILLLPFVLSFRSLGGVTSAQGTLLTSSAVVQAPLIELRSFANTLPKPIPQLFFNSYLLNGMQFSKNVANYLSVPFFFITGSTHGNHGISTTGQFYLFEIAIMLIGLWVWTRKRESWMIYLSGWAVITVGVASLTREAPHATRSYFLLFPLTVVLATGYETLLSYVRRSPKMIKVGLSLITLILFTLSGIHYFMSYTIRFPVVYAPAWRAEDPALAAFLLTSSIEYDKVIIDPAAGIPYTSVLFYLHVPPASFQDTVLRGNADEEGFIPVLKFNQFEFRAIDWDHDMKQPRTLLVTTPDNKPKDVTPLKTVYYPRKPVVFAVKQTIVQYPVEDIAFVLVNSRP